MSEGDSARESNDVMSNGTPKNEVPSAGRQGGDEVEDLLFAPGGVERRLHSRAYHHWISLLEGGPYPRIERLDPAAIADFAPYSVLLDFRGGAVDPRIAYIGQALRDECGLVGVTARIADLPERSLLARLTGRYDQLLAANAPVGFEAEFVNARDHSTLYRGILLPFSSDGQGIDFVYGVINWKELADPLLQASLDSALMAAQRTADEDGGEGSATRGRGTPWPMRDADAARPRRDGPTSHDMLAFPVDAAPGTPIVLVGEVRADGMIEVRHSILGDARLVDRLLRVTL
jgi:hypothetical protein